MFRFLLAASLLFSAVAVARADAAAPRRMELVYDLYRNGMRLGTVVDRLERHGQQYVLTSETRASGLLRSLFPGPIRLESTGTVTRDGLRPASFRRARDDAPEKLAIARLDWKQGNVSFSYKGASWQKPDLRPGAQDQLSQLYQLMFVNDPPAEYRLQVVSGRKLDQYRYSMQAGEALDTPLGRTPVLRYQRNAQPGEKAVTVWIAPEHGNLPVQVRVVEDGVTLEQRLTHARVDG